MVELKHALHSNQRTARLRGASTLSQQVAKLLVAGGERSPLRKLRELLYAVEMEQTLGKARILRLYLDNAPWGAGVCGAQAAAHTYFGTNANQLNKSQAAWLAAILRNPSVEVERRVAAATTRSIHRPVGRDSAPSSRAKAASCACSISINR
jgi:membrane peptidoglycan carboxypeptidase